MGTSQEDGTRDTVWHAWQTTPSGDWTGWDDALWHRAQTAKNDGWSPSWSKLGKPQNQASKEAQWSRSFLTDG